MKRFGLAVAAVLALLLLVFLPAIVVAEAPSAEEVVTSLGIYPAGDHVRVDLGGRPVRYNVIRVCSEPEDCYQFFWSLGRQEGILFSKETTSFWFGEGRDPSRVWGLVTADFWRSRAGVTFSRTETGSEVSVANNAFWQIYRVRTGEGLEVNVLPDQEFVFRGGLCGIIEVWENDYCLLQFAWDCNNGLCDWPTPAPTATPTHLPLSTPTPTLTQLPLFKKIRLPLILSGKSPKPRATPTLTLTHLPLATPTPTLTHLPLATPTCTPTATPQIEFAPLRRWR